MESLAPLCIDAALFGDAGRAHLVEQRIKGDDLTCLKINQARGSRPGRHSKVTAPASRE
jgi:hypothetical protein